jgi:predicted NUDIX family phosphoesterase
MSKDDEKVLCVPRTVLEQIWGGTLFTGYHEGTEVNGKDALVSMLRSDVVRYVRRGDCETDPRLKQIIPYVMLTHRFPWDTGRGSVLRYNRAKKGEGEARLAGKAAVGIGGHINDQDHDADPYNVFQAAWRRELVEEVRIEGGFQPSIRGFVNHDDDDVGKVHIGVLIQLQLRLPCVYPNEPNIVQPHFIPVQFCREQAVLAKSEANGFMDEFEGWSKLVLSNAFPK